MGATEFRPYWFCGLIVGDGYIGDRCVDIFNSSISILQEAVAALKELEIPAEKIRTTIYLENGDKEAIIKKWSVLLELPKENFSALENKSPWKANSEKIKIRVSSKDFAKKIRGLIEEAKIEGGDKSTALVKGLFDAEGSVDLKGYIEFKQKANERGIETVQFVWKHLKKLKIDCTEPNFKKDKLKQDIYFFVKDIEAYKNLVGFVDKRKYETLQKLVEVLKTNRIPNEREIIEALAKPSSATELVLKLNSPYHRIRKILKTFLKNKAIDSFKDGNSVRYFLP